MMEVVRAATTSPWVLGLGLALGCHHERAPTTTLAPAADAGFSRIVVRAPIDPPVGMKVAAAVAIVGGYANPAGPMPPPDYARVDGFPAEGRCRTQSMCTVAFRKRWSAVVFAFDPVVEIELDPPAAGERSVRVRYADPSSVSAALGALSEVSAWLERACQRSETNKEDRLARAAALEAKIREIATADERPVVASAARLALVNGQCTYAEDNRQIARELLDTIAPTAPELAIWTDALRRLGALAQDPAGAQALRREVERSHPNPDVSARLLFLRLADLDEEADPRERERIEMELAEPRLADSPYRLLAEQLGRPPDAIAVAPGEAMPSVELASLDGAVVRPGDDRSRRHLLYFSSSSCGPCVKTLPKVRQFAADHPDLHLVYVLVDTEADAREFADHRAPLPGDIARTDIDTSLRPSLLRYVMTPSFVLTDSDGTVLATSDETKFSELHALLAGLDAEQAP